MSISQLCNDKIVIRKSDGREIGPVQAQMSSGKAIVPERNLDVQVGDHVQRILPNGMCEEFRVDHADFLDGPGGRLSHWTLMLSRPGESRRRNTSEPQVSIGSAYGVQIGNNNSQNVIAAFESVISAIDCATASHQEKREAKSRLMKFLEHPLVVAVLGGAAAGLLSSMQSR